MLLLYAAVALAFDLAVTIDDLPWQRGVPPGGTEAATERLLGHLTSRGVPVTGFVNCGKPDQALLSKWTAAGASLGNHTWSHVDLDQVGVEAWLDDARRCQEALGGPRWFRYPYLRMGKTAESRDAARKGLDALGLGVAQVTVDNHEWQLAFWYDDALAVGDTARAGEIATEYVAHLRRFVEHYREVARAKTGREIAQVLLLHANTLAAHHLGTALDALAADGATYVTLDAALADPVYALPDERITRGGLSWLYHVSPAAPDYDWDDAEWTRLTARFGAPE